MCIFSPHPPLAGQISPKNPRKTEKYAVIFHFFCNFSRNYVDTQPLIKYNVYQTIEITIIKPKTKITMNANSTKSKLRPRRFLNNYHSSIINYQLIARPRRSFFSLLTSNFSLFTLFSLPHLCTYKLILPNKPNFQTTGQTITLVMRKNYNEKKLLPTKKNKPKTHQKRTKIEKKRIKTSQNPGVFNSSKSIIRIRQ